MIIPVLHNKYSAEAKESVIEYDDIMFSVQEDDQIVFSNFLTGNINAIVVEGKWMKNLNDVKNKKSLYL